MSFDANLASLLPPDFPGELQATLLAVTRGLLLALIAGGLALVGWLVAALLARATQGILSLIGVDASVARLQRGGAPAELRPSRLVGYAVFWCTFLAACVVSLRAVGLDLVPSIALRIEDVVPRVLTSALVLVLGIPFSVGAGRILNALLSPTGVHPGRVRSQAMTAILVGFTVLLALEQLGLAAQLVMAIGIAAVAAAGLALALAFGLGCRDLARDLIIEYLRTADEGGGTERR
jgi:hypothetical protein